MPHFSLMLVTVEVPTRNVVLDAMLPHKTGRSPRWQSFIVGGRWSHRMLVTPDGPTDSCRRGEVDPSLTFNHRRMLLTKNYEHAVKDVERSGVRGSATLMLYDVDPTKETLDDYLKRRELEHPSQTHAFLAAGAPWLDDLNQVGFSRMFDSVDPKAWVTIVDCWVERARLRLVSSAK